MFRNISISGAFFVFLILVFSPFILLSQNFKPAIQLELEIPSPNTYPQLADFDGDGDTDILCFSINNNPQTANGSQICMYENIGTKEQFEFSTISCFQDFDATNNFYWDVGDYQNDGDIDIFALTVFNELSLLFQVFENTGDLNFILGSVIELPFSAPNILNDGSVLDFDHDGDLDLMITFDNMDELDTLGSLRSDLIYFENLSQSDDFVFENFQINPFGFEPIVFSNVLNPGNTLMEVADFDADGDYDILQIPFLDIFSSTLMLYSENIDGEFQSLRQISGLFDINGLAIPGVGDMDNDDDVDIIFNLFDVSIFEGEFITRFYYLENTEFVTQTTDSSSSQNVSVLPNPASDQLFIAGLDKTTHTSIQLINANGHTVYKVQSKHASSLNIPISHFHAGLYYLKILNENGIETKKIVVRD